MATMTLQPTARPVGGPSFTAANPRVGSNSSIRTRTVLTARGRRVLAAGVVLSVLMLAYLLSGVFAAIAGASSQPQAAPVTQSIVVQAGDTLWRVASQLDPQADPRALVDRIAELNGLDSRAALQPGQTLVVPVVE